MGVYRLLKELKSANLRAVFAVNGVLLQHKRALIDMIIEDGHEIAAHGWDTDSIHWSGLDRDLEASFVRRTRDAFAAMGLTPRTWMSPARQQSAHTPDLIKAAGFDVCLDWESDGVPWAMRTDHGPLTCVPLSNELDDRKLLIEQRHSEAQWRDQSLPRATIWLKRAPLWRASPVVYPDPLYQRSAVPDLGFA
ncbi:MAG: polysaccharide deacetylase family protein [Hyphomonadaceae bacterium]|nr:polysaccharide deacetylase family protein [Hyphomonadaceae bacterium]